MKKRIISIPGIMLSFVLLTLLLSGCSKSEGDRDGASNTAPSSTIQSQQPGGQDNQKAFTLEELKKYDGKQGNPAYIAVNGKVYDVTNVGQWKGGKHKGYKAGTDLSREINRSPHGLKALKDVPVVGTLSGN